MIYFLQGQDETSLVVLVTLMAKLDKGEYIVDIKKNRPIRSLKANKFYHAILKTYAIETGHTHAEIESMFKMARWYDVVEYPSGKTEKIPRTTHDRDTKEFASMLNNLIEWGKEEFPAVKIKRQEDFDYHKWITIETEYERVFSGF